VQHVLTFCCFRCFCGGLGGPTKETPDVLTESTSVQYIILNTHAAQAGSKALVGLEPVAFLFCKVLILNKFASYWWQSK